MNQPKTPIQPLAPTIEVDRYEVILGMLRAADKKADETRADLCGHLAVLDKKADRSQADVEVVGKQVQALSIEMESRFKSQSLKIKQPSSHDLDAQAAIAAEVVAREQADRDAKAAIARIEAKTDTQTEILSSLGKLARDPKVIGAAVILWTIIQHWAEKHGYL